MKRQARFVDRAIFVIGITALLSASLFAQQQSQPNSASKSGQSAGTANGTPMSSSAKSMSINSPIVPPGMALVAVAGAQIVTPEATVIAWVNGEAPDILDTVKAGPENLFLYSLDTFEGCGTYLLAWSKKVPAGLKSQRDRDFVNAWLLNNSGNDAPPETITPDAQLAAGDFRLFNDFGNGRHKHQVGNTPVPCLPLISASADDSPYMGASGTSSLGDTYQLAEGRLGTTGRAVSQTVNGRTVPWIWSVIEFDKSGNAKTSDHGIFPTYTVYKCKAQTNTCNQTNTYPQSSAAAFIAKDQSYERTPFDIQ